MRKFFLIFFLVLLGIFRNFRRHHDQMLTELQTKLHPCKVLMRWDFAAG